MLREDLPDLLYETLQTLGGRAEMMTIFRKFWEMYGEQFTESDDLFYTWNYDIRWAATELRNTGRMKQAFLSPKGVWEII